jgi:hypothetical protein
MTLKNKKHLEQIGLPVQTKYTSHIVLEVRVNPRMPFSALLQTATGKIKRGTCLATLTSKQNALAIEKINYLLIKFCGSYAKAGEEIHINRGTLYAVVFGQRPASKRLRAALGIRPMPRRTYDLSNKAVRAIALDVLGILHGKT